MFVDVRLLGPVQVVDRTGQTIEIADELPKALLAVLALEAPTPVGSDRIVDALWGEEAPQTPEASLHSTVSRLRHALGKDIIKRVADSCLLEIPVANSDLARFRRHVQRLCGLRGLRLAAHAAPVFEGWDPIAGASLFFGAGVTPTDRIEPRTSEGEVDVTRPFAALAALVGDLSIACQYVGTLPTAKGGYGSLPLYALHQKV